ncbi:MAG: hypothetical protein JWP34_5257 [Massilia sp.]|nr:hypothetical protein [Massilia sp.]
MYNISGTEDPWHATAYYSISTDDGSLINLMSIALHLQSVMALSAAIYARRVVIFLSLLNLCSTLPNDKECVSKSFAIHNLTAVAPQVVIDSSSPDNNAVVFRLFNPITEVSGECAAHGVTLAPDNVTGNPGLWYNCFVESRDPSITVQFQYDSALDQLTVNETWVCEEDEDDGTFQCVLEAMVRVKNDEGFISNAAIQGRVPGIRIPQLDVDLQRRRESAPLPGRKRRRHRGLCVSDRIVDNT